VTSVFQFHQCIGHLDKKHQQEISELQCTVDEMDLADMYKIFHPTEMECLFFNVAIKISPKETF
jgi:hypothetical protein